MRKYRGLFSILAILACSARAESATEEHPGAETAEAAGAASEASLNFSGEACAHRLQELFPAHVIGVDGGKQSCLLVSGNAKKNPKQFSLGLMTGPDLKKQPGAIRDNRYFNFDAGNSLHQALRCQVKVKADHVFVDVVLVTPDSSGAPRMTALLEKGHLTAASVNDGLGRTMNCVFP
ncbi:MAG: hypothetical protein JST16_00070 [Bdellovibrionales bacterium]|nr:hypothetical protein [Bdellovibrionales bacterium]